MIEFRIRGKRLEPPELLPGRYKGKRKRREPKIAAPCPAGCNWRSRPGDAKSVERQVVTHLKTYH